MPASHMQKLEPMSPPCHSHEAMLARSAEYKSKQEA